MKHIRKVFTLVLATIFAFALAAPAFAATITVDDVLEGETYKAYKILEYTSDTTKNPAAYSYYLETSNTKTAALKTILEGAGFSFTESSDGSRYVLDETTMDADTIVAALKNAGLTENNALAYAEKTATADGEAVFTDLDTGYWFVTTTTGSLCSLASYDDQELVVEKNTVTQEDKKQGTEAGTYADAQLDMNIGDTVYYDVDITIGAGANQDIVLTDAMDNGLDLNQDAITVKIGSETVAATNYTLDTNAHGFTLTLLADYVKTLKANDVVVVEYSAVINESAVIRDANNNTATLTYSNQEQVDTTVVKTYDAQVKKIDASTQKFLDGAGFKLYDALTGGNQIKVNKDATGYYVDADADEEIMITSANGVNIRGLAPGTYYLEETTVPDGYNKLAARKDFTVTKDATAAVEISVENNAGSVLPSTGGIGTTIFYVVGGVMVVGAAVMLVAKRRAASME